MGDQLGPKSAPVEGQRQNLELNDIGLFSDIATVRELTRGWWEPGIHLAPWKPRFLSSGVVLLGIARNGHLWGMHEAPKITPALIADVRERLDASEEDGSGGLRPSIINYDETDAIEHGEHGRLLRVEAQYQQDRTEYGKLIGMGAAVADPGLAGQDD